MPKASNKTKPKSYKLLVPCHNNKTGKQYAPGAIVTSADFPVKVLAAWAGQSPPAAEEIE